ncbi:MAG: hypothetical protein JSS83_08555 [Cyanobacteria bacterium SZAS LIN-3]|nr:hypothetical protein [Cyanobacteria bacterium SZAS LIN-3]
MYQEPEKTKLSEGQPSLTEGTGEGTLASNTANKNVPATRPADAASKAQAKSDRKRRGPSLVLEKPSRLAISLMALALISMSGAWYMTTGPLAPSITQFCIARNWNIPAMMIINGMISRQGTGSDLLLQRATVLMHMHSYAEALKDTTLLLSRSDLTASQKGQACVIQGEVLMNLNRAAEAQTILKQAGQLNRDLATEFHRRGFYYLEYANNPSETIKMETMALWVDPDLPKSYLNLSAAYRQTGQYQKSVEAATRGLALDTRRDGLPDDLTSMLLYNRSLGYFGLDRYADSVKDSDQSFAEIKKINAKPEHSNDKLVPISLWQEAKALLANNQPAEALKLIEANNQGFMDSPVLSALQKEALLKLNRTKEAEAAGPQGEEEIEEAFTDFVQDTSVYFIAKDHAHTISAANRALALKPDSASVLRMRAEAYLALKQYENVVKDTTAGLATDPQEANMKDWLLHLRSLAWEKLGQPDKAKADDLAAREAGYVPEKTQQEQK